MAVELSKLYREIYADYDVELLTSGCFGKKISWVHIMERQDFAYLLHGDELIFNSGLNYESEEGLREFIDALLQVHAGGLVVAKQEKLFTKEIIQYCNKMQFPLFSASWETSYIDIMHRFSEIIISDERNETNLIAALKNAIYYPEDDKLYQNHFERNGYFQNMPYIITVFGCGKGKKSEEDWNRMEKFLHNIFPKSLLFQEQDMQVFLTAGYEHDQVEEGIRQLLEKEGDICAGEGTVERQLQDIHHSYETAVTAYGLAGTVIPQALARYEELGVYQILADRKEAWIYPEFVEKTLGKLIEYDRENHTGYIELLESFFDNECNIARTASALYFHRNTLKYKLSAIKDILGYEITENRHRVNIMLSLALLRMQAAETEMTRIPRREDCGKNS